MTTEKKIYPSGTATISGRGGRKGYIIRSWEPETIQMLFGAHGMQDITRNYLVFYPSTEATESNFSEIDNNSIAEDVAEAERCEIRSLNENEIKMLEFQGLNEQEKQQEKAKAERDETQAKRDVFKAEFKSKTPAWAKAVIFAEFHRDDCDLGSDYFSTLTERLIILAWSKHKRDLFPEMRKAALNHPDTAFLYDTGEKAEHRNKYSMGGGYFLSVCGEYSTGWRIKKRSIEGYGYGIPDYGEWSLPDAKMSVSKPDKKSPSDKAGGIEEHTHTKKGFQMFIVLIPYDMERDDFNEARNRCKDAGGWYTRKWRSTPCGFAFEDRESAERFQAQEFGDTPPPPRKALQKMRLSASC